MKYFFINLKNYKQSFKNKEILQAVIFFSKKKKYKDVKIVLCPPNTDLEFYKNVNIFSQHFDERDFGAKTGKVILKDLKNRKVLGSLISHSEDFEKGEIVKKKVGDLKKERLMSIVCCRDLKQIERYVKFKPDFIAFEPKELIGGDISITRAKPIQIAKAVKMVGNIPLIIGAGINKKEDVKSSIELNAQGILVASKISKSKNPKKIIKEFLDEFVKK